MVTITAPIEDETVSGFFWIEGTGTRVGASGKVEVRIDDGDWRKADGTAIWTISWDTEVEQDGTHTVSARGTDVSDRTGAVVTVNVEVSNVVNQPPVVEPIDDMTVEVGQDVSFKVVATDPECSTLVFSDDTLLFNINPSSGQVSFLPGDIDVGSWHVEITVWDGEHQTKTKFIITVEPKKEEELLLGFIPLTFTQLVMVLVIAVLVVAVAGVAVRSRRGRDLDVGSDSRDPHGSRGEAA